MGKVSFLAAQVPSAPTYNWAFLDPTIGMLDVGLVSTDAPGPAAALPRAVYEPQLGQKVRAWDPVLGFGEFIYLAVPVSTAVPLGTLVSWEFGPSGTQYSAVAMPAGATALNTGAPCAVCVASTNYNSGAGIASNAAAVQYAWFQIGGAAQVLKTAVQVAPVTTEQGAGVYLSGTAGRIYVTASAGKQILGARLGNQTTVTSTSSCVLVYLNGSPTVEGK